MLGQQLVGSGVMEPNLLPTSVAHRQLPSARARLLGTAKGEVAVFRVPGRGGLRFLG